MLTNSPMEDCRLCYSMVAAINAVFAPINEGGRDDTPKHLSIRALHQASVMMPTPPGALFDPEPTDHLFTAEQARQARASLWNVVLMVRCGWRAEQINRWIASGAKQDIPGFQQAEPKKVTPAADTG